MPSAQVDFKTPLKTVEEGKAFIKALHDADMMFHFEDSPETIITGLSGDRLFSDEQARDVRDRVDELYGMDWKSVGHECPIGYALEVMGHVMEEDLGDDPLGDWHGRNV